MTGQLTRAIETALSTPTFDFQLPISTSDLDSFDTTHWHLKMAESGQQAVSVPRKLWYVLIVPIDSLACFIASVIGFKDA